MLCEFGDRSERWLLSYAVDALLTLREHVDDGRMKQDLGATRPGGNVRRPVHRATRQ